MEIVNFLLAVFPFDKIADILHRPGAVERVHRNEVADRRWPQFAKPVLHSRTFKLEHRDCLPFMEQFKRFLITFGQLVEVERYAMIPCDQFKGIF